MPIPFPYIVDGVVGDVPKGFYPATDSDRQQILVRQPGLKSKVTISNCTEIRELIAWNGYLYGIAKIGGQSTVFRANPTAGTYADIGTVTTSSSGPAWMKVNPTQMAVCDGIIYYIFTPGTGSFIPMADAAFEGAG